MRIFSFFPDHFITSAPSRLRADKVEADKKRRRKRERAGGKWVRENIKRTDRREGQIESWEQRMEMGWRNNAGRMMGSSYSRSRGSGLTFCGRQRAGGGGGETNMPGWISRRSGWVKAQRNMKAHQRTRQEVAFPFHQSDKRSTAFIPTFLSRWPCCLQRLFNLACFSWPFPFFPISTFSLWKIFLFLIFSVQFKGNIVCILHMFLGLDFFRLQNLCAFCDCREKKQRGGREIWIQKAEKKPSSGCQTHYFCAFAYHGGIPRAFHHVNSAVDVRKCQPIKAGGAPQAGEPQPISTEVHFHCLK